jgi:hypothetical protein
VEAASLGVTGDKTIEALRDRGFDRTKRLRFNVVVR